MQVHGRLPTSIMQHTCHSFTVLWYPFTLVDGLRQCGSQVYCPTPQDLYMYPVLLVKSWSAQGPVVKGWIILSNRWYVTMWLSVNWTNWAINWIAFSPVDSIIHLLNNRGTDHLLQLVITWLPIHTLGKKRNSKFFHWELKLWPSADQYIRFINGNHLFFFLCSWPEL